MNKLLFGILFALAVLALPLGAEEPNTPKSWHGRVWSSSGEAMLTAVPMAADGQSRLALSLPGKQEFVIGVPQGFPSQTARIDVEMSASAPLPADTLLYVFTRDWEYRWRQLEFPVGQWSAKAGAAAGTLSFSIPISGEREVAWQPVGHSQPWTAAVPGQIREWGFIFTSKQPYQGTVTLRPPQFWDGVPGPLRVRPLGWNPDSPQVGALAEGGYEIDGWRGLPFDPRNVSLTATIVPPSGPAIEVSGFYMEKFQRTSQKVLSDGTSLVSAGRPCFALRYVPSLPGLHRIRATVAVGGQKLALPEQTLSVAAAARPFKGFVHVDAKDTRFLSYDDGSFFQGVMLNVRSPYDTRYADIARYTCWKDEGLDLYARLLPKYGKAGINVVEIWMSSWWLALEWTDEVHGCHGVGWYNQRRAWMLDRIFEWAAANQVQIVLVLNNHGKFGSGQLDSEWTRNPYFKSNGGPVADCQEFFRDDACLAAQRQLYRYVIARWGASPQLLAWKLFTEIDLAGNSMSFYRTPSMSRWHEEMSGFFHDTDPWRHPVTTHWMMDYNHVNSEVASLPKLDLLTIDAYYMGGGTTRLCDLFRGGAEVAARYKKPCLVTEYGGSAYGDNTAVLQRQFYLGAWLAFFNGHAWGAGFWWYPLVEEKNLYGMVSAFLAFTAGEDPRGARFQSGLSGGRDIELNLMRCQDRLLLWGFDRVGFANERNSEDWVEYPDYAAPVGGLAPGTYAVEAWNTATGVKTVQPDLKVAAETGIVDVKVPPFKRDFALKLIRKSAAPPGVAVPAAGSTPTKGSSK